MGQGIDKKQAITASQKLIGKRPEMISFPGGQSRESVRLHFADENCILTRRRDSDRARREARIVSTLHAQGAPVPEIRAFDGLWLIQEDLGGNRLSHVLNGEDPIARASALEGAVASLAECHEAARRAEPVKAAHLLGFRRDWIDKLVANPAQIGGRIGVTAPALDTEQLVPFLRVRTASLVKWDARPGNAVIRDNGVCAWFDWENCGRRNPPDDLVWLLADEFMPEDQESEIDLLQRHIGRFATGFDSTEEALLYFLAFGVFHIAVRLELILYRRLQENRWWDFDTCLNSDRIGVTRTCALQLCLRGARWSMANPMTRPLGAWFGSVAEYIAGLDDQNSAAA